MCCTGHENFQTKATSRGVAFTEWYGLCHRLARSSKLLLTTTLVGKYVTPTRCISGMFNKRHTKNHELFASFRKRYPIKKKEKKMKNYFHSCSLGEIINSLFVNSVYGWIWIFCKSQSNKNLLKFWILLVANTNIFRNVYYFMIRRNIPMTEGCMPYKNFNKTWSRSCKCHSQDNT